MNQLMHFKPSHWSAQKMLNHWQLNHPNQLFVFNQLCLSLPEVTDHLKCFADFLSDSIRIHDVSLFELSLTQAISRLEPPSQGIYKVEDFFESLTFVAANALYGVAIGDGCRSFRSTKIIKRSLIINVMGLLVCTKGAIL